MMTVPDGYATEPQIDYKVKYKALKKKFRLLVYEHECFLEELRKAQRKLLKVARDRSFLLDRLIQYEKVEESSGDSDATASSDSDGEGHKDGSLSKKRKLNSGTISVPPEYAHLVSAAALSGVLHGGGSSNQDSSKKRSKSSNKRSKGGGGHLKGGKQPGQMTREELERHLDSRQSSFGLEKAPANLPMDIFNNDNSNPDSDLGLLIGEDDDDLVIDVPQ
ncbi:uncharacterized protein LOC126824847 isoform X1 [Patella vulgata]|uniref:uncharacterized protein LOC126824847 isoform X1 n=1 Tax=Patella vulgata TaxID=6465 RepID=UPI00217FACCB|nr:uncharacterized protein LOC126824847 isoform X1 [Patella vulgata]